MQFNFFALVTVLAVGITSAQAACVIVEGDASACPAPNWVVCGPLVVGETKCCPPLGVKCFLANTTFAFSPPPRSLLPPSLGLSLKSMAAAASLHPTDGEDHDETRPLLGARRDLNERNDQTTPLKRTPLPLAQLYLVLFLQLAEPLTSQVIYPFLPQLIRDIGVTNGDETKVGYYVGMVQSLFFLTQAVTVLHWSRLSDRIGRKPVILIGLSGLSILIAAGSVETLTAFASCSRSLNGALNGNIGVIKSMVAEMTDNTNIAQAYAYMPIAWSTGGVLGPIIGGSLAHPVERFPSWFGCSEFLKHHPYFLPCAVPATYSIIAWTVTSLFLKETANGPHVLRLSQLFTRSKPTVGQGKTQTVLESGSSEEVPEREQAVPLRGLMTKRVLIAASNYAFLSLVDIALRAIQPLFFATPIELGGLGLPTSRIGNLLSVFGVLNGVFQIFFFAPVHDLLGSKLMFIVGVSSALPTFATFPLLSHLAKSHGISSTVWAVALLQITMSIGLSLSYGAVFIYISAAAPNRASLGATNGLCQLTADFVGPWMVYYVLMATTLVAIWVGMQLPAKPWTGA
ncbi:unnamed protein product [Mycena citricolor]|uniref:Major facilitator superfamily (MFS) profile domain-containing protein n=1 Tax=Mycena citricolor TaxID=2018698 RepID=A0AAD2JYB5_9AGAR|nr:unnamed protein product [Mycena citricolor]